MGWWWGIPAEGWGGGGEDRPEKIPHLLSPICVRGKIILHYLGKKAPCLAISQVLNLPTPRAHWKKLGKIEFNEYLLKAWSESQLYVDISMIHV